MGEFPVARRTAARGGGDAAAIVMVGTIVLARSRSFATIAIERTDRARGVGKRL
jgi:hypothetical protein